MSDGQHLDFMKAVYIYAGSIIFNVGFGFYLLLAVPSIFLLWKQPVHNAGRRVLLVYTIVMLVMNTVFFVFMAIQTLSTISVEIQQSEPLELTWLGLVVPIILRTPPILLNDILFIYRAFVILTNNRTLLVLPYTLYALMIVLGVLDVINIQVLSKTPSTTLYFLLFIAASILLNCFLTFFIARNLMKQQRSMFGGGSTPLRSWHSTVITVMVESATAWVFAALLYLVTLLIRSRASFLFEYLFQITAQLGPAVLIFRVALNKHYATPTELKTRDVLTSRGRYSLGNRFDEHGQSRSRSSHLEQEESLTSMPLVPPKFTAEVQFDGGVTSVSTRSPVYWSNRVRQSTP